jgi:hypothetical protein
MPIMPFKAKPNAKKMEAASLRRSSGVSNAGGSAEEDADAVGGAGAAPAFLAGTPPAAPVTPVATPARPVVLSFEVYHIADSAPVCAGEELDIGFALVLYSCRRGGSKGWLCDSNTTSQPVSRSFTSLYATSQKSHAIPFMHACMHSLYHTMRCDAMQRDAMQCDATRRDATR